jgi:hypothetical protein
MMSADAGYIRATSWLKKRRTKPTPNFTRSSPAERVTACTNNCAEPAPASSAVEPHFGRVVEAGYAQHVVASDTRLTGDARPAAPRGRADWPAFPYGAVYFRKSNPPRTD